MLRRAFSIFIAVMLVGCQVQPLPDNNNNQGDQQQPDSPSTKPAATFTVSVNERTVSVDASGSTGSGGTLTYIWDFNGEAQASGVTSSHIFNSDGKKRISLVVMEGSVSSDKTIKTVTVQKTQTNVNHRPVAAFTISSDGLAVSANASASSDPDGDSLTYHWNINNGEAQRTGKILNYVFNSGGPKSISLIVKDATLSSTAVVKQVTLTAPQTNRAPVAEFNISVDGLTVDVNASGSTDADGDQLTYRWNFNGQATRTGKTAQFTFSSGGNKTIELVVNDGKVDSTTKTKTVTVMKPVVNTAPIASFTVVASDLKVTVDGSGSSDTDGDTLTYLWTFDGNSLPESTSASAEYTFNSEGTKTISLVVNDGSVNSAEATKMVQVTEPAPENDYSAELTAITAQINKSSLLCMGCHGTPPRAANAISFGSGSEADVKNGFITYLTKNPKNVDLVKGALTTGIVNGQQHQGGAPFSDDPLKTQWITLIDGIVMDMNGSSDNATVLISEDYEQQTVGQNPAGWGVNNKYIVVDNPDANQYSDYIRVVDDMAHTGNKSLYVNGNGLQNAMRYSFKKLELPNNKERVFVRYYMRSSEYIGNRAKNPDGGEPNHNHFMALENGQNDEIRIGEVKGALGVNEYGNDDIVPKDQYWWGKIQTKRIEANTWYCIETAFLNDGNTPVLKTWVDDELVTLIDERTDFKNYSQGGGAGAPEYWLNNKFGHVAFGWANYTTYDNELYFDDIVVSTERVGCM
jgi:PKD repeat protein